MPRSQPVILTFGAPDPATQPTEIFAVQVQPSTCGARIIVECEGPAELLAKIKVKVIKLPSVSR